MDLAVLPHPMARKATIGEHKDAGTARSFLRFAILWQMAKKYKQGRERHASREEIRDRLCKLDSAHLKEIRQDQTKRNEEKTALQA